MHPEHKLLKFVILPIILILLGYLAWYWVETPHWWYDTRQGTNYYHNDGSYNGPRELTGQNLGKFLGSTYELDKLKGVFAVSNGKTTAIYCSSNDPKVKITADSKFRVASVSKVVTSLAILQLADQGKLNLNDKVEKFITYKKHFPKSPTVEDLLLQTAGFDNNDSSRFYKTKSEKPGLEEFVYRKPIEQVIEPHKLFDYTNTAFDIAGLIVQKVSGQRFEDYCDQSIFKPLDMTNTSFNELGTYELGIDSLDKPVENYFVGGTSSSGLITTANDMGIFINCLLNEGKHNGKNVFSQKVMEMVFTPRMNMGNQMLVSRTPVFSTAGSDANQFSQSGEILGFTSDLTIEKGKAAIFNVCAGENVGRYFGAWIYEYFFLPPEQTRSYCIAAKQIDGKPITNPEGYNAEWINISGWNRGNFTKITNAAFYNLSIKANKDELDVSYTTMKNIDSENFGNGYWYIKFIRDDEGGIKYLQNSQNAYVKAPWYMNEKFLTIYGFVTLGFFLLMCLQWLLGAILRAFGKEKTSSSDKLLRICIATTSILNLTFFVIIYMTYITSDLYKLGFKPEFSWYVVFTLPIIGTLLTIPVIIGVVKLWIKKLWTLQARLNASLFVVVQCLFIWTMIFWNLLGYNF